MRNVISIGYGRHLFESGNIERQRLLQCAEATVHTDLIIFSNRSHGLTTQVASEKLTLYPTNSRNKLFAMVDAFLIARKLTQQSSVSVTLTSQDPFETALIGLAVKFFYNVKLIIQEHGDFFGTPHWRSESVGNQIRYRIGRWTIKRADVVRVVSQRTAAHVKALGAREVATLPVAIDATRFRLAEGSQKHRELFPSGSFIYLSAARFVPQKNLQLLLKAFFKAHATAPHTRLLLVGNGSEEAALRALIATHQEGSELIKILPWSADLPELMCSVDAYALSSNYEGWGRVLIEAMAAKLPMVTTAVGCAEEVVVWGKHGLVVPIGDEDAFSKAMHTLATDVAQYQKIKTELTELDIKEIPGTDSSAYATQWAHIFAT